MKTRWHVYVREDDSATKRNEVMASAAAGVGLETAR